MRSIQQFHLPHNEISKVTLGVAHLDFDPLWSFLSGFLDFTFSMGFDLLPKIHVIKD
jgi:hypothetical protein